MDYRRYLPVQDQPVDMFSHCIHLGRNSSWTRFPSSVGGIYKGLRYLNWANRIDHHCWLCVRRTVGEKPCGFCLSPSDLAILGQKNPRSKHYLYGLSGRDTGVLRLRLYPAEPNRKESRSNFGNIPPYL